MPDSIADLKAKFEAFNQKWSKHGHIDFITWKEYVAKHWNSKEESTLDFLNSRGIEEEPKEDYTIIDYDYSDDQMTDAERNQFPTEFWDGLMGLMHGRCDVFDFDGSGSGLYYGIIIYDL